MLTAVTSRRVLIALAVVLGLNSQLNTRHLGWVGTVPNAVVKTLTDPVASLMRSAAVGFRGEQATPTFVGEGATDAEIEDLSMAIAEIRRQREELSARNADVLKLWEQNAVLRAERDAYRAAAEARGSESIRVLDARVADRNLSRANPTLEIDKGTRDGIEEGDPVVVGANLVGFVQKDPGTLRALVQLTGTPGAQFRVRLLVPGKTPTDTDEPVYVYATEDGKAFICDLPDGSHQVRVGDIASLADPLFEQAYGYVLGSVVEVTDHPDDPTKQDRIIVRSPIDPSRLRDVTIQVQE